MAAKKHTHQYHRISIGYKNVWACALPNCSHYVPPHLEGTMEGKLSICFGCGESFIFDSERKAYALGEREGKSYCLNCELKRRGNVDLLSIISNIHPSE
jgi:hypothetical protein